MMINHDFGGTRRSASAYCVCAGTGRRLDRQRSMAACAHNLWTATLLMATDHITVPLRHHQFADSCGGASGSIAGPPEIRAPLAVLSLRISRKRLR